MVAKRSGEGVMRRSQLSRTREKVARERLGIPLGGGSTQKEHFPGNTRESMHISERPRRIEIIGSSEHRYDIFFSLPVLSLFLGCQQQPRALNFHLSLLPRHLIILIPFHTHSLYFPFCSGISAPYSSSAALPSVLYYFYLHFPRSISPSKLSV